MDVKNRARDNTQSCAKQESQSSSLPYWAKPIAKRFARQYDEAYALRELDTPGRPLYDEKMRNAKSASERLQREIQEIRKMTAEHPENGKKYGSYINAYYNTEGKERDKYDELAFWLKHRGVEPHVPCHC